MGVGRSKALPIPYEEACKRVPGQVLKRLNETFKRLSSPSGYLPQTTFTRDVLGDAVPAKLSEAIYQSFGGGQKGIVYKDLICGLVLLVYGTKKEKAQFLSQLVSEDGDKVTRERLDTLVIACDLTPTKVDLDSLFKDKKSTHTDVFERWILEHPQLASFTVWLLGEVDDDCGFSLEGKPDPPSFHQTLAKRFSVDEQVVMDLEKSYWALKGGGKFDLDTLQSYVQPPLPEDLCQDLFRVMDLNLDGHIDLSELIQMVGKCCRGNPEDPHNFCFRMFDRDEDGFLSRDELMIAVQHLMDIRDENTSPDDSVIPEHVSAADTVDEILKIHGKEKEDHLTEMEYLDWTNVCELGNGLVKLLIEICHVRFGLRPLDPILEGLVVGGYLNRFLKAGRRHGDLVYILPYEWFQRWKFYTSQEAGSGEAAPKPPKKAKRKGKRSKSTQLTSLTIAPVPPRSHSMVNTTELGEDTLAIELNQFTHRQSSPAALCVTDLSPLRPPPIDNSLLCVPEPLGSKKLPSLTNEGGRLIRSKVIIENKEYVVLSEVIWRVFVSWYGTTGYSPLALPRLVGPEGEVELYPLVFKLYRHTTNPPPSKPSNLPWPISSFLTTLGLISSGTPPPVSGPLMTGGGDDSNPAQPPVPRRVPYYQAAFPKSTTLREVSEKIQQMLRVKVEDLRLYDFSDDDQPILLENEDATLEQLNLSDGHKILLETRNKDNSWPEEIMAILKEVVKDEEKPHPSVVKVTPGATGLSNLGNTCFMNSALQCVSSTRPLTKYFRERDHLQEINKDNPLGMGGVMAKRYGELVDDLWTGNAKSITPLKFRFTVSRYAPQFNAFQQQDSQELLAFVLDGLHEDLNRVKDKAYRELNDSDGRDDAVVAKEAWDYHLSRNQSIIVDLFQGQLKSVVTCKSCQYQSVRFDPFTFLSLPLPMESTINLEVIVVCLDGSQPMRYGLKLELDDKYRQLKRALSSLCSIDPAHMLLVEVYGGMIRNIPSDSTKIRSVLGGWLYAYELPPPPLVPPTPRSDSPDEITRQLKVEEVRRERSLSIHKLEEEKKRAEVARASFDQVVSHDMETESHVVEDRLNNVVPSSHDMEPGSHDEATRSHDMQDVSHDVVADKMEVEAVGLHDREDSIEVLEALQEKGVAGGVATGTEVTSNGGLEESDGFVFAVHRKNYSVEQYFVSCQKDRPVIFGTPLVVPCDSQTPRKDLYACVWKQVQRLIIPDPPDRSSSPDHNNHYPFILKHVAKDGFSCSQCTWYRFCHGCTLTCDDQALGGTSGYIAVDWDTTALHLKYQSAQERPLEHESMESLKVIDMEPIDLYECFKAFVREDELGDEESWYCKHCQEHREAVKSLEIWRLPPILIIHLKRFQFFNGRWVKSQRAVTFPLSNLDPFRYTARNSNGASPTLAVTSLEQEVADPSSLAEESCDHQEKSCDKEGDLTEKSGDQPDGAEEQPKESCDLDDVMEVDEEDPISQASNETSELYNLFAICCHSGVMGGGHYVSFAKNPNDKWYYFNDSSCKETNESRVNEESPYMLFYELQGLDKEYNRFRVQKSGGKGQDIGSTEDDREYEETLKSLRKSCSIQ